MEKGKVVLLKYVEKKDRGLDEMQELEQRLESHRLRSKKGTGDARPSLPTNDPLQNFEKRYKPRHAVKQVFFDANTG